mmetsp:Transcript_10041/g.18887  ORF Transcript_10041/g.18887 Transcript_10041/m.18887 type:complete len:228 (-) Transcript_10041:531-1214(-)
MAMMPTLLTPYPVLGHPLSVCDPSFASATNSCMYASNSFICNVEEVNASIRLCERKIDNLPAELAMLMIRGEVAFRSIGSIAWVTASVPKKFVRIVISACLSNLVKGTFPYKVASLKHTAALFTRTSKRPYSCSMNCAAPSTESISSKSICTTVTLQPESFSSSAAALPKIISLHPMIHIVSLQAPSFRAISLPIPLLAPVTRHTLWGEEVVHPAIGSVTAAFMRRS